MAVMEINALSTALFGSFSATVILPEGVSLKDNSTYPSLIFIHDMGGNDTDIRTISNLEALSTKLGIFIVAPSLMHSFGMDLRWGGKYGAFVSEELPGICRHIFPLDREKTYVGGIGAGAYSALWHAANHPDVFSKCVLINGRFDAAGMCGAVSRGEAVPHLSADNLEAVFGELNSVSGSKFDVLADSAPVPERAFFGCTEDFPAFKDSADFAKRLKTGLTMGKTLEDVFEAGIGWLCS